MIDVKCACILNDHWPEPNLLIPTDCLFTSHFPPCCTWLFLCMYNKRMIHVLRGQVKQLNNPTFDRECACAGLHAVQQWPLLPPRTWKCSTLDKRADALAPSQKWLPWLPETTTEKRVNYIRVICNLLGSCTRSRDLSGTKIVCKNVSMMGQNTVMRFWTFF